MPGLSVRIDIAARLCRLAGTNLGAVICGYRRKKNIKGWWIADDGSLRLHIGALKTMLPKSKEQTENWQ